MRKKKFKAMIVLGVTVLALAAPIAIVPNVPEAQAFVMPYECQQAALYGWHANWANTACRVALAAGF